MLSLNDNFLNVVTTTFKKTSFGDVFLKVAVTTFEKLSLSDNICNVVHGVIDVDCACWHDLTVTVSPMHASHGPWTTEHGYDWTFICNKTT